ncbi:hypothetical protein [Labedaea rhizosphaerae]|uniref:hypothetical protein n=1 Tax=Labedaea rhizosphaerae TaxID=598644 RepID=UPI00105CD3ED|nr:hypothetical protein [Labedaea rhizosphaerae]
MKSVPANPTGHEFGRPYLSSYQLAIALNRQFRATVEAIGKPLGGAGTGQQDSLAQYLAMALRREIKKRGPSHPVECAYLSNHHVKDMIFGGPAGPMRSSLPEGGFDMTIFRVR